MGINIKVTNNSDKPIFRGGHYFGPRKDKYVMVERYALNEIKGNRHLKVEYVKEVKAPQEAPVELEVAGEYIPIQEVEVNDTEQPGATEAEAEEAEDEEVEDEEVDYIDYETATVKDLKEELDAREIEYNPKATKADLIALLEADDEEAEE